MFPDAFPPRAAVDTSLPVSALATDTQSPGAVPATTQATDSGVTMISTDTRYCHECEDQRYYETADGQGWNIDDRCLDCGGDQLEQR
jgi:hypothetical protein